MLFSDGFVTLIYGAFIARALYFSVPLALRIQQWSNSKSKNLGCLLKGPIENVTFFGLLIFVVIPPYLMKVTLDQIPSREIRFVVEEEGDVYTKTSWLYGSRTYEKDYTQVHFPGNEKLAILNYTPKIIRVCQAYMQEDSSLQFNLHTYIAPHGSFVSPYPIGCIVEEDSLFNCLSDQYTLPEKEYHLIW